MSRLKINMFGIVFDKGGAQVRFSTIKVAVKRIFFVINNIKVVLKNIFGAPSLYY